MANNKHSPRGGHGGSVEVIGESGTAEGGNGGRGGAEGHGQGGDGGGGKHYGSGYSRGGDGGDAGRPARPALGARSGLCYTDSSWLDIPGMTDIYGIPQAGKGGDSQTAHVFYEGRQYCLNILLQLLDGYAPKLAVIPGIIDSIDAIGYERGISTEQRWWDLAVEKYPEETAKVVAHVRASEEGHHVE